MPTFKYRALNKIGNTITGRLEAETETIALKTLQARQLDVFEIKELPKQFEISLFRRKINPKDMARYIRQLATLLSAGVDLLDALTSLAKSNAHPGLSKASENIRKDLRAGERLSNAMEKQLPKLPRYVPRLAELGEATGKSAKALTDAAERMEFEHSMRSEVKSALSYPTFLVVVGGAIVFLLFLFVVPRFESLLGENTDTLPWISKVVLGAGSALKENLARTFIIVLSLIILTSYCLNNANLRMKIRSNLEKFPIIGELLIQSDLGGWARTVGMALDNGSDLLAALQLGEYSVKSMYLKQSLEGVRKEIRAGKNIEDILEDSISGFDPLTIDLIRTGRTSGALAEMLLFIGSFQEKETKELAKRLSTLTEPIAILLISAIVGTIVISIVLAMTSLYDFAI